jgi:hypothetical protein
MKKLLLALALFLPLVPAIAQKIDVEKRTGLISVDGTPSFYLTSRNRALFTTDYTLENLQHQELAYLKAQRLPAYTTGGSTETFYVMTFSRSGNTCELHGFTSFSIIRSLAKSIAAARLVQNNEISREAERKFIMMYNGVFLQDPSEGRRRDNGYDRNSADDRNAVLQSENTPDGNTATAPRAPLDINISNGKIYDGDELLGTYKTMGTVPAGEKAYTLYDTDGKKLASIRRTNGPDDDWQVTMAADNRKVRIRYRAESPLVKLFTAMAEKGYL